MKGSYTQMNKSNYTETELSIYNYCRQRWNYYENRDGGYYPSKHDSKVLEETASYFSLSIQEVEDAFNKVDKIKVNEMMKKLTLEQKMQLGVNILEGNAESPWGQEKIKKNRQ